MKRKATSKLQNGPQDKKLKFGMTLDQITIMKQPLHISIFNFQVDELLKEAALKEKSYVNLDKWMKSFREVVQKFPMSESFSLSNFDWLKDNQLVHPFNNKDLRCSDGTFQFMSPENVSFTGSLLSKTCVKHSFTADILLQLPKEFCIKTDLLDGKWLTKRALYLTWLGKLLQEQNQLIGSVKWSLQFNSPLRPILQVASSTKLCSKWTFNLFPVPPNNVIGLAKIAPTRCNIDPEWFFGRKISEINVATPSYNWLCGIDFVLTSHFKYIQEHLKVDKFSEAIILLKIWLQQRSFNQGDGCISGHLITLFVLYLLEENILSIQTTAYNIFRTTLLYLSRSHWDKDGAEFKLTGRRCVWKPNFHKSYDIVFMDSTGYFNLAGGIHLAIYDELKYEANRTIKMIDSSSPTVFDSVFIEKVQFSYKFDHMLFLKVGNMKACKILEENGEESISTRLDNYNFPKRKFWKKIIFVLQKGFENRVSCFGIRRMAMKQWQFGTTAPKSSCSLVLGFMLTNSHTDLLSKGPAGDEEKAVKDFRSFWGKLSQLRRFKDGSFLEVVKWAEADESAYQKRHILNKISHHLLNRHFGLKLANLKYISTPLEDFIKSPVIVGDTKQGTGEELTTKLILSYDSFCRQLRNLGLPLGVSSVASASPSLRHASVFPPLAAAVSQPSKNGLYDILKIKPGKKAVLPSFRDTIEVMVYFEASGKWPDDLNAIQAIKLEFLLKMQDEFKKLGRTTFVFPEHMLVLWEGYIFKVKICYRKEIYLLKLVKSEDGFVEEVETNAALDLELNSQILPKLTLCLQRLQFDNSIYSSAVRIALRWASAQLLLPNFPSLLVELLMAHVFKRLCVYSPPQSSLTAFLRFLDFVSTIDWQNTPIIINFDSQLNSDEEAFIVDQFHSEREHFPHIFVCTSCELIDRRGANINLNGDSWKEELKLNLKYSKMWTKDSPILPAITRMKALASQAIQHLENSLFKKKRLTDVFCTSFTPFHAEFSLLRNKINRYNERIYKKKIRYVKPYEHIRMEKLPVTGFDSVNCLIRDLTNIYGNQCAFFYDQYGGTNMGVVFRSSAEAVKESSTHELEKLFGEQNPKKTFNVATILDDMKTTGKGLIKDVKLNINV